MSEKNGKYVPQDTDENIFPECQPEEFAFSTYFDGIDVFLLTSILKFVHLKIILCTSLVTLHSTIPLFYRAYNHMDTRNEL